MAKHPWGDTQVRQNGKFAYHVGMKNWIPKNMFVFAGKCYVWETRPDGRLSLRRS